MDNGRGHYERWQFSKVPNQTHRGIENLKMYAIKQIKTCAEYRDICYPGLDWFCLVHLALGLSTSAQVPDKPALASEASPGIVHIYQFVYPLLSDLYLSCTDFTQDSSKHACKLIDT